MILVDLPPIGKGPRGVIIERQDLAGADLHTVTTRPGCGQPPRRRWYRDEMLAVAAAATLADMHGLPLLDMRGGDTSE